MIRVPTYVSPFYEAVSKGDEAAKKYLMNLKINSLINICDKEKISLCISNDFWKDVYMKYYYDISDIPESVEWKQVFKTRYKQSRIPVDFSPLTNEQKIELLNKFDFRSFKEISDIIRDGDLSAEKFYLVKALVLYNHKPKLLEEINIDKIINYYHVDPDVAKAIIQFYDSSIDRNIESYKNMFSLGVDKFVDRSINELNQNIKTSEIIGKITNVPDYDPTLVPINISNEKNGVIFCHGHNHLDPIIPVKDEQKINWTMVDIDPKSKPDIIGSFKDWKIIQELGLGKYDYVITQFCPLKSSQYISNMFIRNVRWLLKPGGKLIIYPGALVHKDEYIIKKILDKILPKYGYTDYLNYSVSDTDRTNRSYIEIRV
jgi:hypothetical protein